MASLEVEGRYRWSLIAILWLILLLNYLDRQVIFSLFPLLQSEFGLTAFQLGLIGTAFLWVYALASPLAGYVADRFGRRRIILASLLTWSAVTWATAHVRTFPELLAARALMGLSEACYLPAGLALIAAWHGESTRALATGIHYSGLYAGMVLGGALGGWMGAHYGWRFGFSILGGIGVAYAVVVAITLRDREAGKSAAPQRFFEAAVAVFRLPGYPHLFSVFGLVAVANWVVYTWLPLYLYESFGMTLAEAGFSATFYLQVGSLVGVALGGWWGDHSTALGRHSRVLTQTVGLALAAPFLFLSGFTNSATLVKCAMVVFGVGRGVFDANAMPALCRVAPPELRSTGFGLFNLVGPFAGGVVAAWAGALKSRIGIGGSLEVTGLLLAGAAGLLWQSTRGPASDTLTL